MRGQKRVLLSGLQFGKPFDDSIGGFEIRRSNHDLPVIVPAAALHVRVGLTPEIDHLARRAKLALAVRRPPFAFQTYLKGVVLTEHVRFTA